HGITQGSRIGPLIKGSLEQPYQRNLRHLLSEKPDAGDVGWVVRGGDSVECLHRFHDVFVQTHAAVYAAGHDGLETHRREICRITNMTRSLKLKQAVPDRLGIVRDALKAALVQEAFLAV